MEEELDDLRTQVKKLQETLEQETLLKVDLKNQIQSLKEDSVFRRKVYEEVRGEGFRDREGGEGWRKMYCTCTQWLQ